MISRPKFSQGAKRDHWQQQIDNWQRSGLSQKQYCLSHSLALSTFCYWKKRLNRQDPVRPKFCMRLFKPLSEYRIAPTVQILDSLGAAL